MQRLVDPAQPAAGLVRGLGAGLPPRATPLRPALAAASVASTSGSFSCHSDWERQQQRRCACACSTSQSTILSINTTSRQASSGHRRVRGNQPSSRTACRASPEVLFTLAGVDPGTLQDVLVGGAVIGAVSAALYSGLKKDPVPCSLCQGTGGIKCFACEGDGKNNKSRDELYEAPKKRDMFGRAPNPRECRVCQGNGIVLCSQCKGSGYMSTF